jgi:Fe-S cluster assembly iron-binding protein IscA
MSELTRESYVESELKKWKEEYIIRFDQEFLIKSMLELQFQYNITPDDHVKTKKDLMEVITRTMRELRLKPNLNKDRLKILVIVKDDGHAIHTYNMFQKMFAESITFDDIQVLINRVNIPKINTKNFEIIIEKANLNLLRGMRADYILNLSGEYEIDKLFEEQNNL